MRRYDKRKDLSLKNLDMEMYTHLLMEANVTKIQLLQDTHRPLAFVEGYSNIAFNVFHVPPVSVRLVRKAVLMERKTATGQQREGLSQHFRCSSLTVTFGLFIASLINVLLVWSLGFGPLFKMTNHLIRATVLESVAVSQFRGCILRRTQPSFEDREGWTMRPPK